MEPENSSITSLRGAYQDFSVENSGSEKTPLVAQEIMTVNERTTQVAVLILTTGSFCTSVYFASQEVDHIDNERWKYSICMWASGGSLALFSHAILRMDIRKRIYRVTSAWLYEVFFIATQFYQNFFSDKTMKILHGGFVAVAGYSELRDLAIFLSLRRSDYEQNIDCPKDEEDLIAMIGANTRNRDFPKIYEPGQLFLALVPVVLFLLFREDFSDNLHRHGFYGNMAFGYFGFRIGKMAGYIADNLKEDYEKKHREQSDLGALPLGLKIGRTLKTGFSLSAPLIIAILLQGLSKPSDYSRNDNPTNSIGDNLLMGTVGAVCGLKFFLERREVENPLSNFHLIRKKAEKKRENRNFASTCEKVSMIAQNYFLTLTCIAALDAFMTAVGVESEMRIVYAVVTLIASSNLSFFATDCLLRKYSPMTNREIEPLSTIEKIWKRCASEVYLQFTRPTLLITGYQYFTTKFSMYDEYMISAPPQLLNASYAGWGLWGAVWGVLRTLYLHKMEPHPFTSDLARIELLNTAADGFR